MSGSDESFSSDVSNEINLYSGSDISFECDNSNIGLYNNEPEYGEELKKKRKLENPNESTTDLDDELDSSRLENLHWCTCYKCCIGLTMTLTSFILLVDHTFLFLNLILRTAIATYTS